MIRVTKSTKITVEMMMARYPCPDWPRERIAAFLGEGKTIAEALQAALNGENISPEDAISGVARFLSDDIKRAFGIWCARQIESDNDLFKLYVDMTERYYAGRASRNELSAVCLALPGGYFLELAFGTANKFAINWAAAAADDEATREADKGGDYGAAYNAAEKKQILRLLEMIDGPEIAPPFMSGGIDEMIDEVNTALQSLRI